MCIRDRYESANLDGAGRLTQFFQITIPPVSYTHLDVYKRQECDGLPLWLSALVSPSSISAMGWQAIGYYRVMYMASMSAVPIRCV